MNNIKAILFDLDNTLFNRDRAQKETLRLIKRDLGSAFGELDEQTIFNALIESDRIAAKEFNTGAFANEVIIGRTKRFVENLGVDKSM